MPRDRPTDAPHALGLAEWLRRRCSLEGDRPALSFEGSSWSYAALLADVELASAVLAAGGIKQGDRVAYLGLNDPTLLITLFATARLGAIFVPLNFRLTPRELGGILDDAQAHTLIVADTHLAHILALRDGLTCQRYIKLGAPSGDASPGWEKPSSVDEFETSYPGGATSIAGRNCRHHVYFRNNRAPQGSHADSPRSVGE